jgi:phytoene dehydrogenase-like protein
VGRGHEVTVLERESGPGAGTFDHPRRLHFDLGPVVMTMPNSSSPR